MNKLLLSATALLGLSSGALAADLPARRLAPAPLPVAVPAFTWTGFYAGVQAGHAWGHDETKFVINGVTLSNASVGKFDSNGVVGGAHAGFNYQIGAAVVGLEGDIEGAGIEGDRTVTCPTCLGGTVSFKEKINVQGSLRGRAGFAFDRVLVYATGGVAVANIENRYGIACAAACVSFNKFEDTQWGWTVGAGVEYAFTDRFTGRIEYRFTQFDKIRNDFPDLPGVAATQEPDFHTVRAGLSYKF